MPIKFVKDKDAIWDTDNFDVILIGTSIQNQLNGGFQSKIRFKYPKVEEENNKTRYADQSKFGTRITVGEKPIISLMYMCDYPRKNRDTVKYDCLARCWKTANAEFKGKNVMSTLIGASPFDGNGDREKCLQIIKDNAKDLNLTIYDYTQQKRFDEIDEKMKYLSSVRKKDYEKYLELKKGFDAYLKKMYLNG